MPYIAKGVRSVYDELIKELTSQLVRREDMPGRLNYCVSSIVFKLFEDNPCYSNANNLMGALSCVQQEFYRRKVAPLEDKKIIENGDI